MRHPKKLNAQVIERLAEAIGDGLPDRHAAALIGISPRTLMAWRTAGKTAPGQSLLARLDKRLAQADAEFVQFHLRALATAKAGVWTRHAWLLERKFQTEFALVQRVEAGAPGDFAKLSAGEVRAKILELVPKSPRPGEVKAGETATRPPRGAG